MRPKEYKTTPDWGGSRPGAGRPIKRDKKIKINLSLAPDVIVLLNEIKASGTSKAVAIETAIRATYGPESKAGKDAVKRIRGSAETIILTRSSIRYGAPEKREGA